MLIFSASLLVCVRPGTRRARRRPVPSRGGLVGRGQLARIASPTSVRATPRPVLIGACTVLPGRLRRTDDAAPGAAARDDRTRPAPGLRRRGPGRRETGARGRTDGLMGTPGDRQGLPALLGRGPSAAGVLDVETGKARPSRSSTGCLRSRTPVPASQTPATTASRPRGQDLLGAQTPTARSVHSSAAPSVVVTEGAALVTSGVAGGVYPLPSRHWCDGSQGRVQGLPARAGVFRYVSKLNWAAGSLAGWYSRWLMWLGLGTQRS